MSELRFDIIENCCSGGAILTDNTGELNPIPLAFSLMDLEEADKEDLLEWLDYLNNGD